MSEAPRKIAVIVALDVAGYSARTEKDEALAASEIAGLRAVVERTAGVYGGRVFNTAGDGFMLEFASSLSAVEAALVLAGTCEPKVRVGVHLGDVAVQPNGDLLGHGVNVAARLMARSQAGSALISADVRRTIRGPLGERLVSRGPFKLDKMTETIEAFAPATEIFAAPPSKSGLLAKLRPAFARARMRAAPALFAFGPVAFAASMLGVVGATAVDVISRYSSVSADEINRSSCHWFTTDLVVVAFSPGRQASATTSDAAEDLAHTLVSALARWKNEEGEQVVTLYYKRTPKEAREHAEANKAKNRGTCLIQGEYSYSPCDYGATKLKVRVELLRAGGSVVWSNTYCVPADRAGEIVPKAEAAIVAEISLGKIPAN